jgi:hypothetical protein
VHVCDDEAGEHEEERDAEASNEKKFPNGKRLVGIIAKLLA